MHILRGVVRWFLSLAIAAMLTAWISLGVLQQTLLNRTTVTGWLRDSGVYQKVIDNFKLDSPSQSFITSEELTSALKSTFSPAYLQQQSEVAINSTYDWVEGKSPNISFTIHIEQKRAEFSANLAKIIETRLAALPQCKTRVNPDVNNPTCIPQGMAAADLAKQFTQLDDSSDFLSKPLTANNLNASLQDKNAPATNWIPPVASSIGWAEIVLPFAIIACAVGFVFLSDNKLKGWSVVSRRVFINGLLLTIVGVVVWQVGGSFKASNLMAHSGVGTIIDPLFQKIIPALASALAVMASGVMIVGGISWGASLYIRHNQKPKVAQYEPPHDLPEPPMPHKTPPKGSAVESPPMHDVTKE
jgi:hypothetical protein